MNISTKPTNTDSLRSELVELRERINVKMKKLYLFRNLPYDRLAKGRSLATLVDLTIKYMDKYELPELRVCLKELEKKGVKIKNASF